MHGTDRFLASSGPLAATATPPRAKATRFSPFPETAQIASGVTKGKPLLITYVIVIDGSLARIKGLKAATPPSPRIKAARFSPYPEIGESGSGVETGQSFLSDCHVKGSNFKLLVQARRLNPSQRAKQKPRLDSASNHSASTQDSWPMTVQEFHVGSLGLSSSLALTAAVILHSG